MSILKKVKNFIVRPTYLAKYELHYHHHLLQVTKWFSRDFPSKKMEKMEKMTILVDLEELHFVLLAFHGEIYEIKVKGIISGQTEVFYLRQAQGRVQLVGPTKSSLPAREIYDQVMHDFLKATNNDVPLYHLIHQTIDYLKVHDHRNVFTYSDYIKIGELTRDDPDKVMEHYGKYFVGFETDIIYGTILPYCYQTLGLKQYKVLMDMMKEFHRMRLEQHTVGSL